jgi:hypothetical protein
MKELIKIMKLTNQEIEALKILLESTGKLKEASAKQKDYWTFQRHREAEKVLKQLIAENAPPRLPLN